MYCIDQTITALEQRLNPRQFIRIPAIAWLSRLLESRLAYMKV